VLAGTPRASVAVLRVRARDVLILLRSASVLVLLIYSLLAAQLASAA
jgi:hypothetical protein